MGLETVTYVGDLVITNPPGSDQKSQGDDHLRNIKKALAICFAGFTGAILVTGVDGGAADAYTLTPATAVPALVAKMLVLFVPNATNLTTTPTLNISALGAVTIKSVDGAALTAGDLVANKPYLAEYDGAALNLVSVTKNYVDQLSFSAALPAQAGNSDKGLVTDGSTASWQNLAARALDERAITAADTVGVADIGVLIKITSGTFTLGFAAAATLGDKASGYILNDGTGDVTLDPNGAETIDSMASYIMYTGELRRWYVEAGSLKTVVLASFVRASAATYTLTRPPGYKEFELETWGTGGGGGSGASLAAATEKSGGAGGGSGGYSRLVVTAADLGASILVTIGAGGTAGAGVNGANGNAGGTGGVTSIGDLVSLAGGGGGAGGVTGGPAAGGTPALPFGAGGALGLTSGQTGGAANSSNGNGSNGNDTHYSASSGGGGGGETAANVFGTVGAGGKRGATTTTGAAAGTSVAGAPTAGAAGAAFRGGGGGGAARTVAGADGGAGGVSAGGGGGGATRTGFLSGAGGVGGSGYSIIRGIL